ncbi:MAG: hypothetical protein AAGI51_02660 [Pseudomonadota bacterium]
MSDVFLGRGVGAGAADAPARMLWHAAALCAALWLLFAAASLTDPRLFDGVDVWIKPQKFALSLALHFATMAWALSWMSERVRRGAFLHGFAALGVACGVLEVLYIGVQAGLGEASHFNDSSPFHAFAYGLMGVGAVILVALSFEVGRRAAVDGEGRFGPGLRWGLAVGLMAGSVATLAFGGYLATQSSHHVGVQLSDAEGLPFVGWATETGDLRPAHFFGTHLMQAAPAIGLAADRLGWRRPGLWVAAGSAAWTGLAVYMFVQALGGRPFLPL